MQIQCDVDRLIDMASLLYALSNLIECIFLVNVTILSHGLCSVLLVSKSFNVRLTGSFAN
jgi:hypothetical protein